VPAPPQPLRRQSPRRRRPTVGHVRRATRRRISWRVRLSLAGSGLVLACFVWAALARAYAPPGNTSADHFDAIIVLGGGVNRDGNPTPSTLARVTEGVHEYERGVAPRLILAGGSTLADHGFVEAETMARVARADGVPPSNLVLEPQSRNAIQNACFSSRIMQQHGWRSAEVVNSAAQLPRAEIIFSATPIEWRGHLAPALEPRSTLMDDADSADEILHTLYYLVFSRWARRCSP
jgi:uncharacterized SAM-binding protein YcdF (DUF218 family)